MASRADTRSTGTAPPRPSLLQSLQQIVQDLPGMLSDRVRLFSLEMRRAKLALVEIVVLAAAAAIFGLTALVALWVVIVIGLTALGLGLPWAVLVVLALNAAGAWFALQRAKVLVPLLALPATMRRFTIASADEDGFGLGRPAASVDAGTATVGGSAGADPLAGTAAPLRTPPRNEIS